MYVEGKDQLGGWFQSSLLTSVAVRNKAPYRSVEELRPNHPHCMEFSQAASIESVCVMCAGPWWSMASLLVSRASRCPSLWGMWSTLMMSSTAGRSERQLPGHVTLVPRPMGCVVCLQAGGAEAFGADVLRWWVAESNVFSEVQIGPAALSSARDNVNRVRVT